MNELVGFLWMGQDEHLDEVLDIWKDEQEEATSWMRIDGKEEATSWMRMDEKEEATSWMRMDEKEEATSWMRMDEKAEAISWMRKDNWLLLLQIADNKGIEENLLLYTAEASDVQGDNTPENSLRRCCRRYRGRSLPELSRRYYGVGLPW